MDPLTVTASVLGNFFELRSAFKRADVTLDGLCTELRIIGASLSQVQSIVLGDFESKADIFDTRPDIKDVFDETLTSCMVLVSCLEDLVNKIKKGILGPSQHTWKSRFRTVWNESELQELRRQIQDQQTAIVLLINLFQTDSIARIHQLIHEQGALLRRIAADTKRLRRLCPPGIPASIFDDASDQVSIASQLKEDSKQSAEPDFEDVVLRSRAYQKTVADIMVPLSDDCSEDTMIAADGNSDQGHTVHTISDQRVTVLEEQSQTNLTTPSTSCSSAQLVGTINSIAITPKAPEAIPSFSNVSTTDLIDWQKTYAFAIVGYKARHPGELDVPRHATIVDLEMIDGSRWKGRLATNKSGERGEFLRENVRLIFILRSVISCPATCDIKAPKGYVRARKDSIIKITEISHDPHWGGTSGNSRGSIYVDKLAIDVESRSRIDAVLDQFKILNTRAKSFETVAGIWRDVYGSKGGGWDRQCLLRSRFYGECRSVTEIVKLIQMERKVAKECGAYYWVNGY